MAVVQVNAVNAQSVEGFVTGLSDVLGFIANAAFTGRGVDVVGEFGGEKDLLPGARIPFEPPVRQVRNSWGQETLREVSKHQRKRRMSLRVRT